MDRTTRDELKAFRQEQPTGPYTVTVHVAAPGTPVRYEDGEIHTSVAGHVHYSVSDGKRSHGYGFSPMKKGTPADPGIVRDEHNTYQSPIYARTLEITSEQYQRLHTYGEFAIQRNTKAFDLEYHGLSNSWVDFTWKGLEHAGLRRELRLLPRASIDLPNGYEGRPKPLDNIRDIERLAPPVPGSPLNREQHNAMPERTLKQWFLSENEAGAPPSAIPQAAMQQAGVPSDVRLSEIREAVHRLDAARGRAPDETTERLAAGLFSEVARNPPIRRVDDVVLSTAIPGHPAGQKAFAVYRPYGDREPVFHAAVDVQAALGRPPGEHYRQADGILRDHGLAQPHLQTTQHEPQREARPPAHSI